MWGSGSCCSRRLNGSFRFRLLPEVGDPGPFERISRDLSRFGDVISHRLEDVYSAEWPSDPIRVDVVEYAIWAGAYSTRPLHIRISSAAAYTAGATALETLIHEAGHGLIRPVQQALVEAFRAAGTPMPRGLWHAIVFYTSGTIVKDVLAQSHSGEYVPYAQATGMWSRLPGWQPIRRVLGHHWKDYIDGHAMLDGAVRKIAEEFSAG